MLYYLEVLFGHIWLLLWLIVLVLVLAHLTYIEIAMVNRPCTLVMHHGDENFGSLAFSATRCLVYSHAKSEYTHCGCVVILDTHSLEASCLAIMVLFAIKL